MAQQFLENLSFQERMKSQNYFEPTIFFTRINICKFNLLAKIWKSTLIPNYSCSMNHCLPALNDQVELSCCQEYLCSSAT